MFAESLAAAALAPLLQVDPRSIQLPSWTPAPMLGPNDDDTGVLARALTQAIRVQYGSRLSARDLRTITRQIQHGLERVRQLKKVDLANGDEPDFVFTPARVRSGPGD